MQILPSHSRWISRPLRPLGVQPFLRNRAGFAAHGGIQRAIPGGCGICRVDSVFPRPGLPALPAGLSQAPGRRPPVATPGAVPPPGLLPRTGPEGARGGATRKEPSPAHDAGVHHFQPADLPVCTLCGRRVSVRARRLSEIYGVSPQAHQHKKEVQIPNPFIGNELSSFKSDAIERSKMKSMQ